MDRSELMSKIKEKIQVEGRSSTYNPLIQKPVQLNPVGPGNYANGIGGYAYVGPPPDFGGSYGAYKDQKGFTQVGIKASKMFSMADGSPMQLHAELSEEERIALLSQLEEASELYKCQHCRSELCISVASDLGSKELHCPHCASIMDGAMEKVKSVYSKLQEKQEKQEKQMATNIKASSGDQLKVGEKAVEPLTVGSDSKDIAKDAMKVETPAQSHANEKTDKATIMEPSTKVAQIKPMDELSKDLVKAAKAIVNAESSEEEKKAKAAAEEEEKKVKAAEEEEKKAKAAEEEKKKAEKKEKLQAAFVKYKESRKAKTQASFDAKTLTNLKRELRVMATLETKKFAEVKKNPKLAAICAAVEKTLHTKAVRVQVRAELKALAAEDMEAAEEAKKELEFVAPEILMEEPIEFGDKKAEGAEGEEIEKISIGEAGEELDEFGNKKVKAGEAEELDEFGNKKVKAEEDEALSMKTEFLASLDSLKGEKIEMSLYGEESENPFWNVTIDGEPTARIHLADQADSAAIRASFTTDAYADNLGKLIGEMGAKKILPMVKAKLFTHKIDESEITARLRDKAKTEARTEMNEKIGTLRSDFLRAVSMVMTAADKNFYQEEGRHALKSGLFNALVQAGLTEQHSVWAIEAGFESAPEYFNFVMDKAVEVMDMPKEARESLEKTITSSGKIDVQGSGDEPEEESLVDRLVKSSVNAIAMGGSVSGENREVIRAQMGLKSTRR